MARALLLRPHDFLVESMGAWLQSLGLAPERFERLDAVPGAAAGVVSCVVVSVAVTSVVKASVSEAIAAGRRVAPRAPLLVAGLSKLESARTGLARELAALGLTLHGLGEGAAWGTPGVALYVTAEDLREPRRASLTATAKKHLKLA